MKKLPHEKLREAAKTEANIHNYYPCVVAAKDFGAMDDTRYTTEVKMLNAIADEIEKYYIPRPRFEDGEPCNIGDEVEFSQPAGVKKVLSFIAGEDGITSANVGLSSGPVAIYAGKVKRHKPKVLDADGVEIKVGDTVWSLNDSTKWKVTETHPTEPRISLRQLDTEKEVEGGWFLSSEYSLREPDSLEKVRDDIAEWRADVVLPGNGWDTKMAEWCDRLTAIMERDA